MKSLLVFSVLIALAAPSLAQTTRTTSPEGTMTESQKGGPASRESKPSAGGQEAVTKGAGPTKASPNAGRGTGSAASGNSAPK
jgi:hypothetical protein